MDLGLLLGTGWASGINLYAVTVLLGLTGRAGWFEAPEVLQHPAVIAVAGVLYLVEFVADKVPYLDNAWDVAHTAIRPLGAAFLGMALAGTDLEAGLAAELGAGAGTGLLALASHATKATARLALNSSPEPVTNVVASVAEDSLVAGVVLLAVTNPLLAGLAAVVLLVSGVAVMVAVWRAAARVRARLRRRRDGDVPAVSRVSGRTLG